jgi:hypothetical protein
VTATITPAPIATNTSVIVRPVTSVVDDKVEDDDESDDDEKDDDDEEDDDDDDSSRKVKRHHNLPRIPRLAAWRRRSIPVISVLQNDPEGVVGVPQGAFNNVSIVGVMLPQMINATTGRPGVLLSQQCVQMILWPNQM